MDRTTLRGIAFWTTLTTSLMTLMISALYTVLPLTGASMNFGVAYRAISVIGFMIHLVNTGSLMLFLGLMHYDLVTAQRLSEHARDYLIRDLTQSTPQHNSPPSPF